MGDRGRLLNGQGLRPLCLWERGIGREGEREKRETPETEP